MKPHHAYLALVLVCVQPTRGLGEDLDAPDPFAGQKAGEEPQGFVYEHDLFSIQLGGGLLIDYNRYWQDDASEEQMALRPESGLRDLRGLASGRTPWSRVAYTLGYLYEVADNEWRFRQTGLIFQVPELGGSLFVGRTKEGFSTNKLMVGYYGWFNERSAANDAFLPILNDGARWTAQAFNDRLVYNIGAFTDWIGDKEKYNKNDWAFVARAVLLPLGTNGRVLHVAGEARYAGANDGSLQYRSKPESFFAQAQAVDTGMFEASRSLILGAEVYYVDGPFSFGSEYYFNQVSSTPANDPLFHGGEAFVAYMFTGETHPYNPKTGVFRHVTPATSAFDGGPGAWELALRLSYVDLDSEEIAGGTFARGTAILNWYLNDMLRLEAAYGYGRLDRDGLEGTTHFLQTRIQLSIK